MWNMGTNVYAYYGNQDDVTYYADYWPGEDFDGLSMMNNSYDFAYRYVHGNVFLNRVYCDDYAINNPLRLKLVACHEFGHELGLAHNPDNNACIMYGEGILGSGGHVWAAYLNNNNLAYHIAVDDFNGVNSIY